MSDNVEFTGVGYGYTGQSKKGTPYIHINLRNDLASQISYGDLTNKIYLFKAKPGQKAQYNIMAPIIKK